MCVVLPAPACLSNRPILYEMNRVLFNEGRGNEEFANLPRKINVCISPSRDDFPHTQVRRAGAASSTHMCLSSRPKRRSQTTGSRVCCPGAAEKQQSNPTPACLPVVTATA